MTMFPRILLASFTALALTACGGDENVENALGLSEPKIRLAHASPIAPAVTLDREGIPATQATSSPYGFVSDYFTIDTGSAAWGVKVASSGASVGSVAINADRGHRYTIVAVADGPGSTSLVTIDDPSDPSLTSDDGSVRVFNASVLTQSIDVYLSPAQSDIATLSPDFPSVGFKTAYPASGADSLRRRGVTYKVSVTLSGTKAVLFQGTVAVPEDRDLLLLAVPTVEGSAGVRLLSKVDGQPGATEVPSL
ncbi:MAG: DUF4397 domain-containing protein [Lautropia sp.]